MNSIQTIYNRFLDLYCIALGNDESDPAEGGETRAEIMEAVSKIVDDLTQVPELAEKELLRRSRLYKAAEKALGEMESRLDYIEATSEESEAIEELREALLACEASNIGAKRL